MYQYLPFLRERGADVVVHPLLDDDYLSRLYSNGPIDKWRVLESYLQRLGLLLRSPRSFDVIWLQWEIFPWLPFAFEGLLFGKCPVVADYDDSIFHRYDLHANSLVRRCFGRKIDHVMSSSRTVVVGNDYLGQRAHLAGAKRVELLPSVIDLNRYQVSDRDPALPVTVGWIGSPTTAPYLSLIAEPLAKVCRGGVRLVVVGADSVELPEVEVVYKRWSEDTEVGDIQNFDIGVMPLTDDPWSRGKCGYKLIQYMACGKPTVCSPVGVNSQIVTNGLDGFHAESSQDWAESLELLLANPEMRKRFGDAARVKVERRYCLQVTAEKLLGILREACGR